jgi:hypothetical protein
MAERPYKTDHLTLMGGGRRSLPSARVSAAGYRRIANVLVTVTPPPPVGVNVSLASSLTTFERRSSLRPALVRAILSLA